MAREKKIMFEHLAFLILMNKSSNKHIVPTFLFLSFKLSLCPPDGQAQPLPSSSRLAGQVRVEQVTDWAVVVQRYLALRGQGDRGMQERDPGTGPAQHPD